MKKITKKLVKKKKKLEVKVVAVPDLHFPWCDQEALDKVYDLIKKEQPTHVIQLGDMLDLYSFSRYEKDASFTTPEEELSTALAMAKEFWETVQRLAPKAKCFQLIGNHEDRLHKTVAKKAPELMGLIPSWKKFFGFKGVKVAKSSKDHFVIDKVIYTHGHYTKLGDHAKFYGKSVCHGHSHRPGIYVEQKDKGSIFELDCGYLGDHAALPLQYTQSRVTKWTKAVGIIFNRNPQIILLE